MLKKSEVVFLCAPVNSGKTAFIQRLLKELGTKKIKTGGVYAVKKFEGLRRVYTVFDILSGKNRPLLQIDGKTMTISRPGFAFASKAVLKAKNCKVAIIDEFGPLEVSGRGYARVVKKITWERRNKIFIVIRKGLAARAAASLKLGTYRVLTAKKTNYKKVLSLALSK